MSLTAPSWGSPRAQTGEGLRISWHSVTATAGERAVLHNVSGSLEPGGLTAVIGPRSAGKSLLLELLAGEQRSAFRMKGEVRVNDRIYQASNTNYADYRSSVSFLSAQNLKALDTTPRELINFHVSLRLRPQESRLSARSGFENFVAFRALGLGKAETQTTDLILTALGLEKCADTSAESLTLSEKMRTLIGAELVRTPAALVLDDPLQGLDVSESATTVQILKSISRARHVSVIFSASQLSSEVFNTLDKVVVLSRGSVVYAGPPELLTEHFAASGHECPPRHAPVDFVLLLLEMVDPQEHRRITENWAWTFGSAEGRGGLSLDDKLGLPVSEAGAAASLAGGEYSAIAALLRPAPAALERPPVSVQFEALSRREFRRLFRNWGALLLRTSTTAVMAVLAGFFFYQLGDKDIYKKADDLENYAAAMSFVLLAALFGEVETVAATIPSTKEKFLVEYSGNLYGSIVFFMAQMICEVPVLLFNSFVHLVITYWMIGLKGKFFYWWLNIFAVSISTTSFGWLISCLSQSTITAMQMLPIVFLPQILFSGVVADVMLVPPGIRWLQYFCYLKYTLDLIFINEFEDKIENEVVKNYLDRNFINRTEIAFNRLIVAAIIIGLRLAAALLLSRRAKARR